MSKTIGDKEAQRRALRERSLKPAAVPKVPVKQSPKKIAVLMVPARLPHETDTQLAERAVVLVNTETKTPFDRTAYQREYMRTYRKTVKARKAALKGEK